ncbi:hypothetical protein ACVW00_003004 [Marmoricola sp. URHA0025 HA25]
MSTPVKVAAFVAGLAAVFAAAFGLGALTDPDTEPAADHGASGHDSAHDSGHDAAAAVSVHLALSERSYAAGRDVPVSFQLQTADGTPVTAYDVEHEKQLHLIVLGTRELTDFQHVHPTLAPDGTWSVALRLEPGSAYRMYADGSTGGEGFLATADFSTTGGHPAPGPVPEPATTDRVDGFTVQLDQADGAATLRVTRAGQPVALEPYLGALGHLVVIRVDDLAYLHAHPAEGPTPVFAVSGLAPGRYRYFFDFQVGGVVRTAAFTVDVDKMPSSGMSMGSEDSHDGGDHG